MGIYATGTTARTTMYGFPEALLKQREVVRGNDKHFELKNGARLNVGDYACMYAPIYDEDDEGKKEPEHTLYAYSWHDSGVAAFLSSVHPPNDASVLRRDTLSFKFRGVEAQPTRKRLLRETFDGALFYNMFMCGVDTNDNMRARYFTQKPSMKWWHGIFYWMLDVGCINAYILYCMANGIDRRADSQKSGRYDFLVELVKQLAGIDETEQSGRGAMPASRSLGSPSSLLSPESVAGSSKKRKIALDHNGHIQGICSGAEPIPFKLYPRYADRKHGPKCVHCFNVLNKGDSASKSRNVCLGCGEPVCDTHWWHWPPHKARLDAKGFKL
jgi:hypothetical protein